MAGVTLADKAEVTSQLLRAGATIAELNTVRKHLSRLKGGALARAAAPARVVALVLSDVVGDDLSTIASGPTVPDPTTFADAQAVLAKYRIDPPPDVRLHLEAGAAGKIEETPKPGDRRLAGVETIVVATPKQSLDAAAALAPNLWLFAAAQGLLIGFGSAAAFIPLVADTSHWFVRRRGLAMGICASGNW